MEDKRFKVLKMIAEDMESDARNFDGKPFNGKTVGDYFGKQGAAIAALSTIVESLLENLHEIKGVVDSNLLGRR